MKWKTPEERLYYGKYQEVTLKNHQNWFKCYKLPGNVYAICEPQHFQEVNAFLIVGSKKSILFDTGMGIANIKEVVDELFQGELIVINSHFHFDHIGDNWRFPTVIAPDDPYVKAVAESGIPPESLGNQMEEDMFLFDYPNNFNGLTFAIKPYTITTAQDGDFFDLGDRVLEYATTPGHSADCIMLYDKTNHLLFTGDMFYLGALYLHFDCDLFGSSDLDRYLDSITKVLQRYPHVKKLYMSHNDFMVTPEKLSELQNGLTGIQSKALHGKKLENLNHGYLEETEHLTEYSFDGFSVIVKESEV